MKLISLTIKTTVRFYILRRYRNLTYKEVSFLINTLQRKLKKKNPGIYLILNIPASYLILNIIEYNLDRLDSEKGLKNK